jgi:TRAP-type C4-dicarboxylate transport system substrate-binding protein
MDRKHSLAFGAALIVSAAIAGCGGAAPAQTGPGPKIDVPVTKNVKATLLTAIGPDLELDFADTLKKLSAGSIDVTVTGDWRPSDLNNEADLVNEVASGKAQFGYIGARGFDTAGVNSFAGLQAPMLIDSLELEAKVLATDWAQKLLDGPRSIGVVGLGYVQGELRQPLGITRDLLQVADFQGARIGARPSRVTEMTLKALGAISVPTPAASVNLPGLDGLEMGMPGIAGNGYDQGARSFTGNLVFWARPNIIFANANWFDSLTADQQGLIRAAARETDRAAAASAQTSSDEARGIVCARGLSITTASQAALAAFHQVLQPVENELAKDPATKATIDAILALRGSTDTPGVVAPCPKVAPSPSLSTGPTPLDGTWRTSFTKAELIASPLLVDNGEINDGNWGDFTMTFDHGRFTSTQSNSFEHGTGSGTFYVTGDAIYMHIDQTGENFAYRWSIFKNTLTFKRDETIGGGPTPSLVKPWTRVP